MTTNYSSSALIEAQSPGIRILLVILFWVWGGIGFLFNTINFFALTGSVGVGTSSYMAATLLLWIGGMLFFRDGCPAGAV